MRHAAKNVLVTGGAQGIGAAIASRFVNEGANVCVLDLVPKNTAPLEIQVDVADPHSVKEAFKKLLLHWERIDILVNNAGISIRESFEKATLANWNRVLGVNLTGPFLMTQEALSWMKKGGVIINIASVSGHVGMPNYVSYNVSKAGVIEFTKTLALELAPYIRVNAISPGYVLTPMQKREYTPEEIKICASKIPLGRLGTPEEIAGLASYLASDEASYATGQVFVLDGGETAGGLASK